MADFAMFQELADDIGFGPPEAALLIDVGALVEDSFGAIVERFYEVIVANPRARAVFDDDAQIERQKVHLEHWLHGVFCGVYDEAFFERRARIGRIHVRVGLGQRYMISMMNVLRTRLSDALRIAGQAEGWTHPRMCDGMRALDAILDLELAIMLETYREDFVAKMRAIERLATIGQLAATIGHELRNPLAVIDSSVHLLRSKIVGDDKAAKHVERIGRQVAISNGIITDLLELARDRDAKREPTDLDELITQALAALPSAGADVRVDLGRLVAIVDPGQLRAVVANFVQNAVDAAATWVRVSTRDDGGVLELVVEDDGEGFSKEVSRQLFEPLYTTKAKGTGLGLALCRRVADKHGGTVSGESLSNGGARFVLRIPNAFSRGS